MMFRSFLFLCLSFSSFRLLAAEEVVFVQDVVSVPRPDTFVVNIEGWPAVLGQKIPVVLDEVDIPKLNGPCAEERRLAEEVHVFLQEKLAMANVISLHHLKRDRFFKIRAWVQIDHQSLNEMLVTAGYAKMHTSQKLKWCIQEGKEAE